MPQEGYSDAALRAAAEASQHMAAQVAAEARTAHQLELSINAVKEFAQTGLDAQWKQSDAAHEMLSQQIADAKLALCDKIGEVDRQSMFRDAEHERETTRLAEQMVRTVDDRAGAVSEMVRDWRGGHERIHERDAEALRVALSDVARVADLHARAHEQQHGAHNEVHGREREAGEKAENRLDQRLADSNHAKEQAREDSRTFITREVMEAQVHILEGRVESGTKERAANSEAILKLQSTVMTRDAADEKLNTAATSAREAERIATARIEALEKTSTGSSAASLQTRYLFAALISVASIALVIWGLYLTHHK